MVVRLSWLLLGVGCGPEDDPVREVSQGTYPSEYAEAICSVQIECTSADVTVEECRELTESSVRSKLERNCFNEDVAVQCLDILDEITCNGYEENVWSVCGDVDDCTEV